MTPSLKVIENLIELLYNELRTASINPGINDKSYHLLKEASIDAINLKRKVELARAFIDSEVN